MQYKYYLSLIALTLVLLTGQAFAGQTVGELSERLWNDGEEQIALALRQICEDKQDVAVAFHTAVRNRKTVLIRFLLTDRRVLGIGQEDIEVALRRACHKGHEETVDVLLELGRVEPPALAELCADAVERGHEDVVETMNEALSDYILREKIPAVLAVVLVLFYLRASGQERF